MSILSFQSHVVYGHAGNSSAVFPLQKLGFDVWPLHTVHFSNHTGYDTFHGEYHSSLENRKIIDCILEERKQLEQLKAILSGYLGSSDNIEVIKDTIEKYKKKKNFIYFCDPVMGDTHRGFFVKNNIPELIKKELVPLSDYLSPNHFEFEYISDTKITTEKEALKAAQPLFDNGTKGIMLTSFSATQTGKMRLLAIQPTQIKAFHTDKINQDWTGTGDLISSLCLGHILKGKNFDLAANLAMKTTFKIIQNSYLSQSKELMIIKNQDIITNTTASV